MKRILLILVFLPTITFSQSFQNDISSVGLGLVAMTNTNSSTDTLHLYKDKSFHYKYRDYLPNNYEKTVIPKFFKPDYGIVYFVAIEKNKKYYKLLFNFSDTAYCKVDTNVRFISWDTLLLNSTGISRLADNINPIKSNPEDKATNLEWDNKPYDKDLLTIINIKGEWVQVKDYKTKQIGWIKWKFGVKLAVDIYLLD